MYEYGIYNTKTNERKILFGYTLEKACKRANVNLEDYVVEYAEYMD